MTASRALVSGFESPKLFLSLAGNNSACRSPHPESPGMRSSHDIKRRAGGLTLGGRLDVNFNSTRGSKDGSLLGNAKSKKKKKKTMFAL